MLSWDGTWQQNNYKCDKKLTMCSSELGLGQPQMHNRYPGTLLNNQTLSHFEFHVIKNCLECGNGDWKQKPRQALCAFCVTFQTRSRTKTIS